MTKQAWPWLGSIGAAGVYGGSGFVIMSAYHCGQRIGGGCRKQWRIMPAAMCGNVACVTAISLA